MPAKKYRVVLHAAVPGELRKLPKSTRAEVRDVIDGLSSEPRPPSAARLKGRSGAYRIRIGNYRLVYEVHATEIIVFVIGVAHRKEVYRRVLRRTTG